VAIGDKDHGRVAMPRSKTVIHWPMSAYSYGYSAYYGYGDRPYYGFYGARY